jgi:hypothetical protein
MANRLHTMNPEELQNLASDESKAVADTFAPPANMATTPIATENDRKTGEIKGGTSALRSGVGYPNGGTGDGRTA